jgi:peptidoglycan/LPS O-acetylase OafA/YrhL
LKLSYRPEIDGLRAIAVFSVIFYHANFAIVNKSLFSGGFLGVDIFFVISGYLITSIILKEIYKKNNFCFINFYERRVRRIIPALLFVIFCSLPFAYEILLIEPIIDFSKSIISSIFFISNIYFNFTGNRYGEEHTLLKPFLHTWSLSVEEQFYILFPIFFILIIKFFKKYLIFFFSIGLLISISFSQYSSIYHPGFNFYQIFTRGFELLLGSLLSYFELNNKKEKKRGGVGSKSFRVYNQLFPKLGIILIIFSFFFFNDKDLLPSVYSLVPLSGACLIIWFSHKDELITKILSNKIFVFFGLISYSLYLFHYPIFAFSRILEIFNDYYKLIFIFLTILISIFSYYFIERTFRDRRIISLKKLIIILLSSIVFLISFNFYIIKEEGIKSRLPKIFQQKSKEFNVKFHQQDNLEKVILIGDSHARSLEYYLNEELKKNNFSLFSFSTSFYLKDFNFVERKTKEIDINFIESNNRIDKFLKENSNLIIVFHQRWSLRILETFFDNEEGYKEYKRENEKYYNYLEPKNIKNSSQQQRAKYIKEGLISEINNIINQGHKLILVYPVPEMAFEPHKLLRNKNLKNFILNKDEYSPPILSISYEVYKKRNKLIFEILDSVQNENIYRVYPHSHFCDKELKNRCVSNNKENIFYYDDDHLSLSGSKFVVDDILKIIKNIQ